MMAESRPQSTPLEESGVGSGAGSPSHPDVEMGSMEMGVNLSNQNLQREPSPYETPEEQVEMNEESVTINVNKDSVTESQKDEKKALSITQLALGFPTTVTLSPETIRKLAITNVFFLSIYLLEWVLKSVAFRKVLWKWIYFRIDGVLVICCFCLDVAILIAINGDPNWDSSKHTALTVAANVFTQFFLLHRFRRLREFFLFKWFQVYQDNKKNLSAADRVQGILREILGNQAYPLSTVDAARLNWVIMVVGSERFRKEAGFSSSFSLGARADEEGLDAETTAWLIDTYSRAKMSGNTLFTDNKTPSLLSMSPEGLSQMDYVTTLNDIQTFDEVTDKEQPENEPSISQEVKYLRQISSAQAVLQRPHSCSRTGPPGDLDNMQELELINREYLIPNKAPPPPPTTPPPPPPYENEKEIESKITYPENHSLIRQRSRTSSDDVANKRTKWPQTNCSSGRSQSYYNNRDSKYLYSKSIIHEELDIADLNEENKKQCNDNIFEHHHLEQQLQKMRKSQVGLGPQFHHNESDSVCDRLQEDPLAFSLGKSKRLSTMSSPAAFARQLWTYVPSISSSSSYYSRDDVTNEVSLANDGHRLGFYRHVTGNRCGLHDKDIRNISRYITYSKEERRDSSKNEGKTSLFKGHEADKAKREMVLDMYDPWIRPDRYCPTQTEINRLNEEIDSWEFNVFELDELSSGRPLSLAFCAIMRKNDLYSVLNLNEIDVVRFIVNVENGYHTENPYHNRIHAADVVQTMHHFFTHNYLRDLVTTLDVMCAFVSAAIHDYQHPGIGNPFLIATKDDLALEYNDRAVLENMHVSSAFRLMNDSTKKCNILSVLGGERYVEARETIIQMVLATDMSHHADGVAVFKNEVLPAVAAATVRRKTKNSLSTPAQGGKLLRNLAGKDSNECEFPFPDDTEECDHESRRLKIDMRRHILNMTLHCADLSNPAKPQALCRRWATLVQEEFFMQGDKERDLGLPISMFMDRNKPAFSKCQSGFLRIIVKPLFTTYCQFLPSLNLTVVKCINENISFWEGKQIEEENILMQQEHAGASTSTMRFRQNSFEASSVINQPFRRFSFLQSPKATRRESSKSAQNNQRDKLSNMFVAKKKSLKNIRSLYQAKDHALNKSQNDSLEVSQSDYFKFS